MSKLTKKEKDWIKKLQTVLDECPSKRIGFYTIGDNNLFTYDLTLEYEINDFHIKHDSYDFDAVVRKFDASFDTDIYFPTSVLSTAG